MQDKQQQLRFFIFVVLTGTIGQLAAEVYIPSLPYIAQDFQTRESLVQLSISYFLLGMASTGVIFGYISDHIGRRTVLFTAAIIGAIGTVVCIISPNIYWLIFGRLIQGVGFSGVSGIGRAVLRDRLQGLEFAKYAAYLSVATALSIDLAPFIGGFLQQYVGWRIVFALIFVYTIFLVYAIYRYQDIKLVEDEDDNTIDNKMHWLKLFSRCGIVFKDKNFLRYGAVAGIIYAIFMMYLAIVPFIIQNIFHKSPIWFGVMIFILSILYAGCAYINGRLLSKFSISSLLQFGLWLTLISAVLLLIIGLVKLTLVLFIIAIIPMFIGSAFVFSTSDALSFTSIEKNIGVASALMISMRLVYGFIFTALISCFNPHSTIPLGIVYLVLTLLGLFLVITDEKSSP